MPTLKTSAYRLGRYVGMQKLAGVLGGGGGLRRLFSNFMRSQRSSMAKYEGKTALGRLLKKFAPTFKPPLAARQAGTMPIPSHLPLSASQKLFMGATGGAVSPLASRSFADIHPWLKKELIRGALRAKKRLSLPSWQDDLKQVM